MKFQFALTIMVSLIILLLAAPSKSQDVPPPPTPAGSCGVSGAVCDEGFCCSIWGFCGNTSDYCAGENCQSQCWGTSPPPPLPYLCGIDFGGRACPDEDMCCTVEGRCAYKGSSWCDAGDCQNNCNSPPNCGQMSTGASLCPDGQCCSMAGLCADHSSTACHLHCVAQCPSSTFKKQMIISMLKNIA